ncbi:MAG: baseplate J/gp47 family protein [Syntrophothermus sp.]
MPASYKLLTVGAGDQINALIRRLLDSTEGVVVFAIPEDAKVLRNEVNMRLLLFYAQREAKQVVLISADSVVRRLAEECGIKVYTSREVFEESDLRQDEAPVVAVRRSLPGLFSGRHARTGIGGGLEVFSGWISRRPVLLLVLLALLLLGGWVVWANPRAEVVVSPAVRKDIQEFQVIVQPGAVKKADPQHQATAGSAVTAWVPAARVASDFTFAQLVRATGKKVEGITPAKGVVTIFSQANKSVRLPEGTVFATGNGIRFRSLEEVVVPAVSTEYFMQVPVGLRAGQAEVNVAAMEPGTSGNVGRARITVLEGKTDGTLRVINPEPISGGEDRIATTVTESDLNRLKNLIEREMEARAVAALKEGLSTGDYLVDPSVEAELVGIVFDSAIGEEAEQVKATATIRGTGWKVERRAFEGALLPLYDRTRAGKDLRFSNRLILRQIRLESFNKQSARLHVIAEGWYYERVDRAKVVQAVLGRSLKVAEARLRQLPQISSFKIDIRGEGNLPKWDRLINVIVREPSPEEPLVQK